ncbi:MAG: thermonuclease family protein [Rhodospirillales bacterium]|jgi:endonuclease YncB( thermonuclease family)|nr:thermonuclease family protein [Rhodospirillales bacterium]
MRFDTLLAFAAAVVAGGAFAMGTASQPHTPPLGSGDAARPSVAVIDGDTMEIRGETVRLANIDAPELGQLCDHNRHLTTCGRDAALALRKLIDLANTVPTCEAIAGEDSSTCWIGGTDLAEAMLTTGLATALPDAPLHYRIAERRARSVPIGIWKGGFVNPAAWRQGKRLPLEVQAMKAAKADTEFPWRIAGLQVLPEPITRRDPCVIKAVTSPMMGRRYFGPLDPGYKDVDTAAVAGRTFCSDDEARSAGWRHAR